MPILVDNIVEQMSDELNSANKTQALTIGHTTRGNPLIHGNTTTLIQQDYRHGERKIYKTRNDARADIFNYIESFYNRKRRQGYNDGLAPVMFEKQYFEKLLVV